MADARRAAAGRAARARAAVVGLRDRRLRRRLRGAQPRRQLDRVPGRARPALGAVAERRLCRRRRQHRLPDDRPAAGARARRRHAPGPGRRRSAGPARSAGRARCRARSIRRAASSPRRTTRSHAATRPFITRDWAAPFRAARVSGVLTGAPDARRRRRRRRCSSTCRAAPPSRCCRASTARWRARKGAGADRAGGRPARTAARLESRRRRRRGRDRCIRPSRTGCGGAPSPTSCPPTSSCGSTSGPAPSGRPGSTRSSATRRRAGGTTSARSTGARPATTSSCWRRPTPRPDVAAWCRRAHAAGTACTPPRFAHPLGEGGRGCWPGSSTAARCR